MAATGETRDEATGRPWTVVAGNPYHARRAIPETRTHLEGANGCFIAWMRDHRTVDADYIVRAVNAHAGSIAAMEDAVACLERLHNEPGAYRVTVIKQLRTALRVARGEGES
jgi:hypothetical protein